jgi:hypothetical protein
LITKPWGIFRSKDVDSAGQKIIGFSVIFLNTLLVTSRLKHVSVNFNQVAEFNIPVIAIIMGLCLGKTFSRRASWLFCQLLVSSLFCSGDMISFSYLGIVFYTVACVVLAALKVVASGGNADGASKLHPVDLLANMVLCEALVHASLYPLPREKMRTVSRWNVELSPLTNSYPILLCGYRGPEFALNISSLMADKLTSPLTLCIAGNVKQSHDDCYQYHHFL